MPRRRPAGARLGTLAVALASVGLIALAAVAVGGSTAGVRFRVFVALEGDRQVAMLAGPPWRVVGRTAVASGPHNLEASPDGRYVAVTSPPSDTVTVIRTSDGKPVGIARVSGSPHDLAFTPDSEHLWVTAEQGEQLVELSVPAGRLVRSRPTPGRPHDLAISPSGSELWVTIDASSTIPIYSPASGRHLGSATVGGAPHDIAFTPDGRQLWLSNFSSGLLTIVSASARRPLGRLEAGSEPHHFAFGLGCLWASDNGGGTLVQIDPRRRRALGRTRVGPAPHHPTVAGQHVLVAVHGTGRVAIVSGSGRLLATVAVGAGPHGIAAVPPTRPRGSCRYHPTGPIRGADASGRDRALGRASRRSRSSTSEASPGRAQAVAPVGEARMRRNATSAPFNGSEGSTPERRR